MRISFFEGNIHTVTPTSEISIDEYLNMVRAGKYKDLQFKIESIENKSERAKTKAKILPYVTVSGTFTHRSTDRMIKHSGLIAIDLDSLNGRLEAVRTMMQRDEYTMSVFKSVSGNGLCVIVKINPEKHLESFQWLESYYFEKYGLTVDPACKDISRPRFVSYDPDEFRKQSTRAKFRSKKPAQPKSVSFIPTQSQIDRVIDYIDKNSINIAESYDDYLFCGMAIFSHYGERGRDIFHIISRQSTKYDAKQCDAKYTNISNTTNNRVTIGTLLYYAKRAGVEIATHEEREMQSIAAIAKKTNKSTEEILRATENINLPAELKSEIIQSIPIDVDLIDPETPLTETLMKAIRVNYRFERNAITKVIHDVERGRELDDQYINSILLQMKLNLSERITKSDVETIILSDETPTFNPFIQFINERINSITFEEADQLVTSLCNTIQTDTPYHVDFMRLWLMGLPASIDGNYSRIVLVLCGGQYTGKSTWFRQLLPTGLRSYYAETDLENGKDDYILLCQKLIIMDDEFGGKSKKDHQKYKEIVSKQYWDIREPYGKRNIKMRRIALMAGTTNQVNMLNDDTGNTRIIPINIISIDHQAYNSIDKEKLFIALWLLYKAGGSYEFTLDHITKLKEISEKHEQVNFEEELLLKYYDQGDDPMLYTDIHTFLETISGYRKISQSKLQAALQKNFVQKQKRMDGKSPRRYYFVSETNLMRQTKAKIEGSVVSQVTTFYEPTTPQRVDTLPF